MIITHKLTMDLMEPEMGQRVYAVQDDRYCRNLEFTLLAGEEVWEVPEGAGVLVRFRKSDGTGGEYNVLPDGTSCWNAEGNVLTVALAPQVLTAAGLVTVAVSVIVGDIQITTFSVGVHVKPAVKGIGTGSSDYGNVLTVGTVEALEPGSAPVAAITGTAEHPVLHLGIPCEGPKVKEFTVEEKCGGYWDAKGLWVEAEGVYAKRTSQIPVKYGEGFLYSGFGADYAPSAVWYDAVGNLLETEYYAVEEGVRLLTVPVNAEFVRFYSHTYDVGTEAVVLEVAYLPGGDDRSVVYEEKDGGYWDLTGKWIESSGGSRRTNFLLVDREDRVRYTGYGRWTAASVIWYDENGGIVSAEMYCEEVHNRPTSVTLMPPEGAAFARFFSWDAGDLAAVVLGVSLEKESRKMERFKKSNVLFGKKYVACGDEFTAGTEETEESWDPIMGMRKTYPWWIADRNGMTLVNEAVAGTAMQSGGENGFSAERYLTVPKDADYVTLCFGAEGEIGTLEDGGSETVLGAWNLVLEYLLTELPYAKIGIIIPGGECTEEMRDAIASVAEYWGVPYLDLKGDSRVPMMLGGRYGAVSEKAVALRNAAFRISESDGNANLKAHEGYSTVIEHFLRSL